MTMRRIPVVATLVVLAAVALMVRLGFWQLDRLEQKEALIAQYQAALAWPEETDLNRDQLIDYPTPFSHVRVQCLAFTPTATRAGHNAQGDSGFAHHTRCSYRSASGAEGQVAVIAGWSQQVAPMALPSSMVEGTVVPDKADEPWHWHVVADPPLAGLVANARPDPAELPNNHFAYAMQWFLFAGVALVIYLLALRRRNRQPS